MLFTFSSRVHHRIPSQQILRWNGEANIQGRFLLLCALGNFLLSTFGIIKKKSLFLLQRVNCSQPPPSAKLHIREYIQESDVSRPPICMPAWGRVLIATCPQPKVFCPQLYMKTSCQHCRAPWQDFLTIPGTSSLLNSVYNSWKEYGGWSLSQSWFHHLVATWL